MVEEDRLVKSCPSAGGRITSRKKVSIGKSESLLASIREGREMTQAEKLRLIISLSIPSILAQISATVMFFIDASMVGHLGAKASAAIGLVETTGGTGLLPDFQPCHLDNWHSHQGSTSLLAGRL